MNIHFWRGLFKKRDFRRYVILKWRCMGKEVRGCLSLSVHVKIAVKWKFRTLIFTFSKRLGYESLKRLPYKIIP